MTAAYFSTLARTLEGAHLHRPTLVIDRARLDDNIAQVREGIGDNFALRIVEKSLPSVPLLRYVCAALKTRRLMVFNTMWLAELARAFPDADMLIGKPLPVAGYAHMCDTLNAPGFDAAAQIAWLADTPARIDQYADAAAARGARVRLALEVDVGLHRGGLRARRAFADTLKHIQARKEIIFAGIMGYEGHVLQVPKILGGPDKAIARAKAHMAGFVDVIREVCGADTSGLILNTGGSTTYPFYGKGDAANDISLGSTLVQPTDFDVPTLDAHKPAAFIATPVLKIVDAPSLPGLEAADAVMRKLGPLPARVAFIYGGKWMARPVWPEGIQHWKIFGKSSNQEGYALASGVALKADDFMFFRPTQSEAVLAQFGDIAVYEDGRIVDSWAPFSPPRIGKTKGGSKGG